MAADKADDTVGFRLPLLNFATRNIRELAKTYDLDIPRGEAGLIINALSGTSNDTRVVVNTFRSSRRRLVTKITLPSPGYSDIETLKYEIGSAFLHSWLDSKSNENIPPNALPKLLIVGLMRATNRDLVVKDIRFVLDLWSKAALPPLHEICEDVYSSHTISPQVAGYIAFELKKKRLIKPLLEKIISGKGYDGKEIAKLLTGVDGHAQQDRIHDEILIKLSRSVLSPGEINEWDTKVFSSRLLLFSPIFGKNNCVNEAPCSFRDAISRSQKEDWIKEAAISKAKTLPFYAMGRGEALVEASRAYAVFLQALGKGETSPATLNSLLDIADKKLLKVTAETTTGAEASKR